MSKAKLKMTQMLKNLGYTNYSEYLASKHWASFRGFVYASRNHCESCGSGEELNVHHCTYRRIGREKPTDVVVLCKICHKELHRQLNARWPSLTLPAKVEHTKQILGMTGKNRKRKFKAKSLRYERLPMVRKDRKARQKQNNAIAELKRIKERIQNSKAYQCTRLYGLIADDQAEVSPLLSRVISRRATPAGTSSQSATDGRRV